MPDGLRKSEIRNVITTFTKPWRVEKDNKDSTLTMAPRKKQYNLYYTSIIMNSLTSFHGDMNFKTCMETTIQYLCFSLVPSLLLTVVFVLFNVNKCTLGNPAKYRVCHLPCGYCICSSTLLVSSCVSRAGYFTVILLDIDLKRQDIDLKWQDWHRHGHYF